MGGHHCPPDIADNSKPSFVASDDIDFSDLDGLCKRKPYAMICVGHPGGLLPFAQVKQVDAQYRPHFTYVSDEAQYHKDDFFNDWTICGDCEDYALTIANLLGREGEGGSFMFLNVMMDCDEDGCDAHAALWVLTADYSMVQIDVNDGPKPIPKKHWGSYEALIPLDGSRKAEPFPGFVVNGTDVAPVNHHKHPH